MSHDMETVANFPDLVSAEMARSALAAEGIDAAIPDENLAGVGWHLGTALGGVRLQVATEDAEAARRILGEATETVPAEDGAWESRDQPGSEELRCIACGADEVRPAPQRKRLKAATMIFFPLLLLWPLLALITPKHACGRCGQVWG